MPDELRLQCTIVATRLGSCRHECLIGCDTMMMMMLAPMNA